MKIIQILIATLLFSTFGFSQEIKLTLDGAELLDGTELTKEEIRKVKVHLPLAAMQKYDKVVVGVNRDFSESPMIARKMAPDHCSIALYPNNESFKDQNEGKEYFVLDLSRSVDQFVPRGYTQIHTSLCNISNYTTKDAKFQIYIGGYFENGAEKYYDNYSNSIKIRPLYQFSKRFMESDWYQYVKPKS
ncbi:MAG: hypothetical protein MRY83_16500 [Flavobacteriales bacterium]|nr:hypothetical protein [Flavobacteriales bacterium]